MNVPNLPPKKKNPTPFHLLGKHRFVQDDRAVQNMTQKREQVDLGLGQTLAEIPEEASQTSSQDGGTPTVGRGGSTVSSAEMLSATSLPTARPVDVAGGGRQTWSTDQVCVLCVVTGFVLCCVLILFALYFFIFLMVCPPRVG